jgi:hypothetical protein
VKTTERGQGLIKAAKRVNASYTVDWRLQRTIVYSRYSDTAETFERVEAIERLDA